MLTHLLDAQASDLAHSYLNVLRLYAKAIYQNVVVVVKGIKCRDGNDNQFMSKLLIVAKYIHKNTLSSTYKLTLLIACKHVVITSTIKKHS